MKIILLLGLLLTVSACNDSNSSDPDKTIYLSCKIRTSHAPLLSARDNDLSQCWDAEESGFESQVYALEWCDQQVNLYMLDQYTASHTVTYMVDSTYCPVEPL